MKWHPDVPDLPIDKPKEIESLELMDPKILDSMPGVEVKEKVEEIAHAVAKAYKKQRPKGDFDECVEVVSIALSVTGGAIGSQVGTAMIAESENAARTACELVFRR